LAVVMEWAFLVDQVAVLDILLALLEGQGL
jgi:hypothetical protein